MRFRYFVSIVLIVFLAGCSSKDAVVISVKVKSPEKTTLFLSKIDFNKTIKLDSVRISAGESVKKFKVKQGEEPEFYSLSTSKGLAITLLASKGEKINVILDLNNAIDYQVSGSEDSEKVRWVTRTFAKSKTAVDELSKRYLNAESNSERELINNQFEQERKRVKDELTKFVWENPMNKASIMALYQKYNDNLYIFDSSDDLLLIKMVATAWKALYPESSYTKGMLEDIKNIENRIANAKMQQLIQNAEMPIPDLSIPDRNGRSIKLSSLKGKVILLDFFTSENTASLLDNRELLEIYKKYKSRGFEVYQISFDATREGWINYIENAGLPWISVREDDPSASNAALFYNVRQLPANYLIGKDFNIIGKNLYGTNLQKALDSYLNK
ncbi:peroxiredoxin family protein [Tenuifilum sp.]|uniref:peroxiredoxin family protein n=1 Tax=Tenuifilum sp. TaxID=2760880 RepID=UPI002C64D88A|nr:TlpA disulfide reductase family protein [Tenuifilum sp.]HOK84878.1 TlpA disulfide reductase family protein [Tenuifilum sp.]HON70417.1 TlpA disulfide reductase family protein [Tenuifilum sp.]HOU74009.1 TlpA disulfide reductase family protein [Tenuifilum sp.]HPP89715.1 TlpA disulfide reductase family protein [Tenuifilum sp.]